MKVMAYFNYTSCVYREFEVDSEDDICQKIDDIRCEITDEEIIDSIQENCIDYDISARK